MHTSIIGIDPGIVDTGLVRMSFYSKLRYVAVDTLVVRDLRQVDQLNHIPEWVNYSTKKSGRRDPRFVFIEKYVPRPGMGTNEKMTDLEKMLRDVLPTAKLVRNTGAKQVVTRELMELFGVWKFKQSTHHQDLRSAARIGLFGALKDPELNEIISLAVKDALDGNPWERDIRPGDTYGA